MVKAYVGQYRHGISVLDGHGGYSGKKMSLLHTVVSAYEVQDIVHLMRQVDPHVIVNVLPTETFFGGFYQKPLNKILNIPKILLPVFENQGIVWYSGERNNGRIRCAADLQGGNI